MRVSAPLAALLLLTAVPAAAKSKAPPETGDRAEIRALHRELASAILVRRLELTGEQKTRLKAVIADVKKLRDTRQVDDLREKKKAVLRKAIEDARKTGKISPATRGEMEELKADADDVRDDLKDEGKNLREKVKEIFTPAQKEILRELKEDLPAHARGKAKRHGKKGFLRILLSDEFAAELDR